MDPQAVYCRPETIICECNGLTKEKYELRDDFSQQNGTNSTQFPGKISFFSLKNSPFWNTRHTVVSWTTYYNILGCENPVVWL